MGSISAVAGLDGTKCFKVLLSFYTLYQQSHTKKTTDKQEEILISTTISQTNNNIVTKTEHKTRTRT